MEKSISWVRRVGGAIFNCKNQEHCFGYITFEGFSEVPSRNIYIKGRVEWKSMQLKWEIVALRNTSF